MSLEFLDEGCSEGSFLCEVSRAWLGDPDGEVDPAVMVSNETPEVVVRLSQNCCATMGASDFAVSILRENNRLGDKTRRRIAWAELAV